MIAEHRRPLMAFILVALVCALVVGNAVRTATFQRLVDGGLPLSVLVPIAPDVLLTINASGHNGLGGDLPYVGRAVIAVSNPAPPSVPAPVTTAVVTVSAASPTTAVQNTPAAAAPAAAATSTRTAGRHHAAPRRAVTATSGTPTVAPGRGTPTLSSGPTKHVAAVDKRGPSPEKAVSHELKRAQHEAEKAAHRQALDQKHAIKAETKHAGKPHHAKPHHQKPHHQKPHPEKRHHDKSHHEKPHHEKRH